MNIKKVLVLIIFTILLIYSSICSVFGKEAHVLNTVLQSNMVKLIVTADVKLPPRETNIYHTAFAPLNQDRLKALVFEEYKSEVLGFKEINGDDERLYHEFFLNVITEEGIYLGYKDANTNLFISYSGMDGKFKALLDNSNRIFGFNNYQINQQAEGILLTPEAAKQLADHLVSQLGRSGFESMTFSRVITMPPNTSGWENEENFKHEGYYMIEYRHMTKEGIPLAIDSFHYPELFDESSDFFTQPRDHLMVGVDDDGIFIVEGYYHTLISGEKVEVEISIDKAIEILEENMDYVNAFSKDEKENVFIIDEVEFCYLQLQAYPHTDLRAGREMIVRPVWRFSSNLNFGNDDSVFTLFIDAITGEVYFS